jgi:HD-like signal output (HDOD) protein
MPESLWIPKKRRDLNHATLKIINKVLDRIPPLPVSVKKIIDMASDMDIGAKELAEVALTDPVLSSKILRLVNSAYYSLNHRIDDLKIAIVLIGFNAVQNIAIQGRFMQAFSKSGGEIYNHENLWIHSYLVSVCTELVFGSDNPRKMGILMTLGILHDIGKFALNGIGEMMREKGYEFSRIDNIDSTNPVLNTEESILGVNHSIIGGMLTNKWNLSDRICTVVEYHHFPSYYGIKEIPAEYLEEISAICISDILVNNFLDSTAKIPTPHRVFFEILGIKPQIDNLLTDELKLKLLRAKEFVCSIK